MFAYFRESDGLAIRSNWLAGLVDGDDYWGLMQRVQQCCELPAENFPDEEPYTAAVLGALRWVGIQHLRGFNGRGTGYKVAFYPRVTSKTREEPESGADVAIVIDIQTPQLNLMSGHLAQVKLLKDEKLTAKRSQIEKISQRDATSTHWFLHDHDSDTRLRTVTVVPTDYVNARLGPSSKTVGISMGEVDVQAMPFGPYIVGDIMGLWLGSPTVVRHALTPATQPLFILGIVVTTGDRDPEEPGWLLETGEPLRLSQA